jgi:hypothetical protein
MFEDQTIELLPARTTMKKWNKHGRGDRTKNVAANFSSVYINVEDSHDVDISVDVSQDASAG